MSSGKSDTQRKGSEELLDLALKNIEEDRVRLVGFLDKNTESEDPLIVGVIAENIAKITDVLTKQTMQIVEMAKIRRKVSSEDKSDEDGELSKGDHDDIYRQIEEGKGMLS
jgi:hypothetical protein